MKQYECCKKPNKTLSNNFAQDAIKKSYPAETSIWKRLEIYTIYRSRLRPRMLRAHFTRPLNVQRVGAWRNITYLI